MKNFILETTVSTAMDEMIEEYVVDWKFMGAVLVCMNGEILLKKGYGFANLEWEIPNTPSTKFQIASVSKQFTAAAIFLLQDQGKLNVNDLVKQYLPDSPDAWNKITILHLLTHTAGIHTYNDADVLNYFTPTRKIECTPENILEMFLSKPLEFEPGERFAYSNSGFVVLGRIIEKISGQSYGKFLQENLFGPLGMENSGHLSYKEILKNRADGYDQCNGELQNSDLFDIAICYACGSLYSTVEDLLKWVQGLFAGKLLNESTLQQMITPFKDNYACGLEVTPEKGRKVIRHKGKTPGFKSVLSYYPDDQLIVTVLSNNEYGSATFEIARMVASIARNEEIILLRQRKEIPLASETILDYVGEYRRDDGMIVAIIPLSEKLMVWMKKPDEQSTPVQDIYWISAESESRFFSRDRVDVEIEFFRNDKRDVSHILLRQDKQSMKAVRQ